MKDYYKNKEYLYFKHRDVNSWFGSEMSQKFLLEGFKWLEKTSQFDEYLIWSFNENSDTGFFLEVDVQYPESLQSDKLTRKTFTMTYNFYLKEWKSKSPKTCNWSS